MARPLGLTVTATVALVEVRAEAAPVTALGGAAVEKVRSLPCVTPASLVATRR